MNSFISNMSSHAYTENGALAFNTTGNPLIDFYYNVSVLERKQRMMKNLPRIISLYGAAVGKAPIETIATALYARAILDKGLGNRFYFREIFKIWLEEKPEAAIALLVTAISKGWAYWDDFFFMFDYALSKKLSCKKTFASVTKSKLDESPIDALFAKWFPRKGRVWQYMRNFEDSPKEMRKKLTVVQTTESLIGANEYKSIDYSQVPSKAFKRHAKAFANHDASRYTDFIKKAATGEVKVKAGAILPHEILFSSNTTAVKTAQWVNLPNLVTDGASFLPVLDCSRSMSGEPLQICHALGIYLSERNKSVFKNNVLTFSSRPHWVKLSGSIDDKQRQLQHHSEVANTNFEQVFRLILDTAVNKDVPAKDLPTHIICLTDGQFDVMSSGNSTTIFTKYEKEFAAAGYKLPHIVFWNLRVTNNFPERPKYNVTLIAGASPNAFALALSGMTTERMLEESLKPFIDVAAKFVTA